jgi:hypothetical protein
MKINLDYTIYMRRQQDWDSFSPISSIHGARQSSGQVPSLKAKGAGSHAVADCAAAVAFLVGSAAQAGDDPRGLFLRQSGRRRELGFVFPEYKCFGHRIASQDSRQSQAGKASRTAKAI